ncbi:DUF5076 domain-containing protein [Xanthomonas arboricola]|uniref:DUF5076 domain-containing protein n=1 Tax=Xanthomonas arboricola TaxID=56448 RepID=UPI000E1EBA47|nr:DUF5076 domain-containing protein [Xanthomonas arboricola]
MHSDELDIPPDALTDPEAFELMRLWAAHGQLHVIISSDVDGTAEDFGELLADLFEHASRMYAQRENRSLAECREAMLQDFLRRTTAPKASIEGSRTAEH